MTQVTLATDAHQALWGEFLKSHPAPHHAFLWGWRHVLSKSFGHEALYLIAHRPSVNNGRHPLGTVVGIAPLFLVNSFLFGCALISVPYLNGGGIHAVDREAFDALLAEIAERSRTLNVKYAELRHRQALAPSTWGLQERAHKITVLTELSADPEKLLAAFPAKLRSQIRRPEKSGFTAKTENSPENLAAFYRVFSENMRDLGTPVYPQSFFAEVLKTFPEEMKIVTVWSDLEVAAAGILLRDRDTIEIPWASALKRYQQASPNMLLYWEALRQACLSGAKWFDFGRSTPNSGTHKFKLQWRAEGFEQQEVLLHWYYLSSGAKLPDINPKSSRFDLLVNIWRRLPLPVANAVGPWITRSLP